MYIDVLTTLHFTPRYAHWNLDESVRSTGAESRTNQAQLTGSRVEVGANPTCAINRVKQSGSLYVGATLEHRAKIGAYRRKMGEQVALAAGTVPLRVRATSVVCVISIGNEFVVVKCVCVCVCVRVTVVRGGFHKHATTCCKCM